MAFPFALLRMIVLSLIVVINITLSVLSAIAAFQENTSGVFQVLAICFGVVSVLSILGCLCHRFAYREEDNTRNLGLFGFCGLFGFGLALALTVHARQDHGSGLCNDFSTMGNSCIRAGVELAMAFASPVLATIGFIISWMDKFPGAVKVTPRYPITKAPSSQFAAYMHDLDESYTHPPIKASSRARGDSRWADVPLDC